MKFKSATIKNFRRFADMTVQGIPETAKLIMLAGPNGCGKSSFFDALHVWYSWTSNKHRSWDPDYHVKAGAPVRTRLTNDVTIEFHDSSTGQNQKKIFYMRSAYRNNPEFRINELQRTGNPLDTVRVSRMIDNDAAVDQNYRKLASHGLEALYEDGDPSTTFEEYRKKNIGEIQEALKKLFPDLELNGLGNPLKDGTFRFTKGASRGFLFMNLSGGEKAAFDLILDLVVARRDYDNTVFCIDEPESHMNTKLQAELLSVLYDLIPINCQLMLATHSIGMMRRARDIEAEHSGSVVFLDFGNQDFDQPQVIEPTMPNRRFWENAHQVALGDLAALVAPERVVICEGEPFTQRPVANHSHDAACYNRIFEKEFPETKFVSMGSDRQIIGDQRGLAEALRLVVGGLDVVRLIDRDDRSKQQVSDEYQKGIRVLSRRNLESYLFDDEVLRALAVSNGKDDKVDDLIKKKREILAARPRDSPDNLKPASGEIYIACKRLLSLTQSGNDTKTFMRDTLAPLIKAEMCVYEELKRDIFGGAPVS